MRIGKAFKGNFDQKVNTNFSNSGKPYVTETYRNGISWYRLWSDGWIEQGGIAYGGQVINFLKPFGDANYCLTFGSSYGTYTYTENGVNRTAYGFSTLSWGFPATWIACGY